jgi:acetylornithine/N-succinyldiaminopimelate aminotransferase
MTDGHSASPTSAATATSVTTTEAPEHDASEGPISQPPATQVSRTTEQLLEIAHKRLYPNYRQPDFVLVEGRGSVLFDTAGRRYLDMAAGVAVCTLGHAHPGYAAAISAQVSRLSHASNYFFNEPNIRLADELCQRTGFDRAFFCNSGAEANEALLKLARRAAFAAGKPNKTKIIAFDNSFHGRTMGALALTGQAKYQAGFGPGVGGVVHVPFGDLAAVEAAMGDDVAAILVEPVQGEGGVLPAPDGFLQGLRTLCDRHDALLLADEVQTGIGRTGRFLGHEHDRDGHGAQVRVDAVALAKGMGGGFPIGAMLCREALSGALPPGTHGSTYGGNPLGSAAALAVLQAMDNEDLVARAASRGAYLSKLLTKLASERPDVVEGERGRGLLRALVLHKGQDARGVLERARSRGVLFTVAGDRCVRFSPPLIVTEAQLDEAVGALAASLPT